MEFVFEEIGTNRLAAQGLLEAYTGKVVPKNDAVQILQRIPDHKWFLSEKLGRDVGARVAAVDLVENFFETSVKPSALSSFLTEAGTRVESLLKAYLTAKGNTYPL